METGTGSYGSRSSTCLKSAATGQPGRSRQLHGCCIAVAPANYALLGVYYGVCNKKKGPCFPGKRTQPRFCGCDQDIVSVMAYLSVLCC